MKRFALIAIILTVGVCYTSAAMPQAKDEVAKVGVSLHTFDVPSADFVSANDEAIRVGFELIYIAEPSGEVVSDFKPPTVIGKINSGNVTSIFKPPVITNTDHLLPDIRRL